MALTGKKPWYIEYLTIFIGTGLMALGISSCFDAAGAGNRGIFRHFHFW